MRWVKPHSIPRIALTAIAVSSWLLFPAVLVDAPKLDKGPIALGTGGMILL